MKSAKAGNRKALIAIGIIIAALIIFVGGGIGVAPAIVNWLLQPWDWAKRAMFGSILNTFHLTTFEGLVNFSTGNADKFLYFLVQIVQTFALIVEQSELAISPKNAELLKSCRNVAYMIEIPINALYNWSYYTDGNGRVNNMLQRIVMVIFFTAVNTLIFEWTITFLFKAIKGMVGVGYDNKVHDSSRA